MSQIPNDSARVGVQFTGDTSGLDVAAEKAAADVRRVSEESEKMSSGVQTANNQASTSWSGQAASIGSVIAKIGLLIGTATTFFSIGRRIRKEIEDILESGSNKAEEVINRLTGDNTRKLKQAQEELLEVQAKAYNAGGLRKSQYEEEAKALQSYITMLGRAVRSEDDRERFKKKVSDDLRRDDLNEKLRKLEEEAGKKSTADYDKEQEARKKEIRDFNEKWDAEVARQRQIYEHNARVIADAERKAKEEERAAERTRKAWEDAYRRIRDAQVEAFGINDITIDSSMYGMALDMLARQRGASSYPEYGADY